MQQSNYRSQFKNIEHLRYMCSSKEVVEIIDKFLIFKREVLRCLERIENQMVQSILEIKQDNLLGYMLAESNISHKKLQHYITDWMQYTEVEQSALKKVIAQNSKSIATLKLSYETTLAKTMKPFRELMASTEQLIESQVDYDKSITLQRLSERDEGIALETNGALFEGVTIFVTVFQLKVNEITLLGFHQPILFDGLYFEQGFNSRQEPHKIRYQIHKGMNLREYIYEECINLFHPDMKLVDEHNYEIMFKKPLNLDNQSIYCISATVAEDDYFGTVSYKKRHAENSIISFQGKDLQEYDFILPDGIQVVNSLATSGLFPAFIIRNV